MSVLTRFSRAFIATAPRSATVEQGPRGWRVTLHEAGERVGTYPCRSRETAQQLADDFVEGVIE